MYTMIRFLSYERNDSMFFVVGVTAIKEKLEGPGSVSRSTETRNSASGADFRVTKYGAAGR